MHDEVGQSLTRTKVLQASTANFYGRARVIMTLPAEVLLFTPRQMAWMHDGWVKGLCAGPFV